MIPNTFKCTTRPTSRIEKISKKRKTNMSESFSRRLNKSSYSIHQCCLLHSDFELVSNSFTRIFEAIIIIFMVRSSSNNQQSTACSFLEFASDCILQFPHEYFNDDRYVLFHRIQATIRVQLRVFSVHAHCHHHGQLRCDGGNDFNVYNIHSTKH